jgi:hypothetical protein
MTKVKAKRVSRKFQLENLWQAISNAPAPVTIREICQLTGLKRTPYLDDLLNELYAHGNIKQHLTRLENGHIATEYWAVLPQHTPEDPD